MNKLTSAQDAIKQAIEGGWSLGFFVPSRVVVSKKTLLMYSAEEIEIKTPLSDVLLDPLFWQALGKARGWECKQHKAFEKCQLKRWRARASSWFYLRMSGEDENKFWQSLP